MPELYLRVHHDQNHPGAGRSEPARSVPVDVSVAVDDAHTVGDLARALGEFVERVPPPGTFTIARTGHTPAPTDPLTELDLLSGDEIVLDAVRSTAPTAVASQALALDITTGPDSGRSLVLRSGDTTIGRSSRCDVVLADRSVSRHHATLTLDQTGALTIVVLPEASNGLSLDGVAVRPGEPAAVREGASIGLGGSQAVVRRFERQQQRRIDRLGQIDVQRTPYRPPVVREHDTTPIGPIPTRPEARRFQMIAVVAPLAAGLAMYAFTRQAQFLLFTLISPVVMIGTAIDDRRSGRRTASRQIDDFRRMLGERRAGFEACRRVEHAERLRTAPDLAELVRRAEHRTIDLWARGRTAPDFLHLRLGLGSDTAGFAVQLESGGDDDLRAEALEAMASVDVLTGVPVTVDLTRDVLAVHGAPELVDGVAASLLVQAATLHSPEDLTVAVAVGPERGLTWAKWLPHLRSVTSPLAGSHLATTHDDADSLIDRLLDVAAFRTAEADHRRPLAWPRVLVVIDASLRPDAAVASRLLDVAADASISVVWLADVAAELPRHASRILSVDHGEGARMTGRLWATDPSVAERDLDAEHLRAGIADRVARSLAPLRDASTSSLATSIPRAVPLLDVLGVGRPTGDWVADRWRRNDGYHLRFPVGVAADGVLELDLVADGPHTLIGGTSGSGKSELLQSMVVALAARHSPERLNFLFVDYKGGAASTVFGRLPHTVGSVTNLSADLAVRALTSLRAELNRRMAIMEGRAKDLAEMLERYPAETPPSLVIVVDEFATLVKEVPDFVAGMVDIAQRGRSLGIHLVLATQRPTGSVNENILANTNLRLSLRMLDRTESSAIIDSPDAADIPVPLRGRGLARLGPRTLVEFQSAFAGAALVSTAERPPVLVRAFQRPDDAPGSPVDHPSGQSGPTQLDAVIDAVVAANSSLALAAPRRPWRDVLPAVVTLDDVWGDPSADTVRRNPGRHVVIGLLDAPETQDQHPAIVDLERDGGLVVYGSGGSGKTTLLRTLAVQIDRCAGGAVTVAFDFASRGLVAVRGLPSVVDVATGDDLEAVTRHLVVLDGELERRRRLLADSGAEDLTAMLRDRPDTRLDRIVVLIDGLGAMTAALADQGSLGAGTADRWIDILHRLVIDGRQVGIHTVVTSDRRAAVSARLQASIGCRLVLRHADPQGYADVGVPTTLTGSLGAPGRALLDGNVIVQVATVSADPSAREQLAAVARQADVSAVEAPPAWSAPLPEVVADVPRTGVAGPAAAVVGVADVSGAPVVIDVEWSHVAVVGPARSGRSTALAAFVVGFERCDRLYVVGGASSPLALLDLDPARSRFGRADVVAELLDLAANRAAIACPDDPIVVVADDVDQFDDVSLGAIWDRLLSSDAVRLVGSVEARAMTGFTTSSAVNELRRARRVLVLQPDDPTDFLQLTGMRLPSRPGLRLGPGRGVLLADRQPTILQIAVPNALRAAPDTRRSRMPAFA